MQLVRLDAQRRPLEVVTRVEVGEERVDVQAAQRELDHDEGHHVRARDHLRGVGERGAVASAGTGPSHECEVDYCGGGRPRAGADRQEDQSEEQLV